MIKIVEPANPETIEEEDDKCDLEEEKDERAEWTIEQDAYLKTLVHTHGPHNWVLISDHMSAQFSDKRKSSKQCRERWCNKLDPAINHAPWAKQEEATLIMSHMKYKNRWCDIVGTLKGRHNNMIKNRFYSIFRKVKNKIKNSDFSYTSKLELIEMYYMLSVMEEYGSNPPPPEEPKRKRGKDFMYTLIEDLDFTQLSRYKVLLGKKCPLKVPLGHLLNEILHPSTQPPERAVSQINMAFAEPMDLEERCCRSSTPGTCPAKVGLMTLPQPKSFFSKEPLTPDEKDFVKQQVFSFSNAKTATSSPPLTMVSPGPMIPVQVAQQVTYQGATPMQMEGYYSSGAGGVNSNFHALKGGFGDLSGAYGGGARYVSASPVMTPPVMMPNNGGFFYMAQMQQQPSIQANLVPQVMITRPTNMM